MLQKDWCFFILFLYSICQALQYAVVFALIELPTTDCCSCYCVIQLSDVTNDCTLMDIIIRYSHAHILET
jgi:hypothetical protein